MIFYHSSCVDFSSFFFPVKGSVKCVIVFQYIRIYSLVFTYEILYKTFVLRSIGRRIESLRRVQGLALSLSALTLQSPNFNHPVPRNVFRPNALTQEVQVCKFVVAHEGFICRSILMARKGRKFKLD